MTILGVGRPRRLAEPAGALLILLTIALLPTVYKSYLVSQLLLVMAIIDLAILWNVVAGFGGQLSLGHGAFFGIGSYAVAVALTVLNVSVILGLLVGVAAAAAVAVLVTLLTLRFRIRGIYFALVTLTVALMLRDSAMATAKIGGAVGMLIPFGDNPAQLQFPNQFPYFYALVGLGFLYWIGARWIRDTRHGIALRAIRDDEVAAEAMGHSLGWRLSGVMAATAALAALVGAIYALGSLQATPDGSLGLSVMFAILVATIIGGIGTTWGPLIGGVVYEGIGVIVSQVPGGTGSLPIVLAAGFGIVLVGIVVLRPQGLVHVSRNP
jgi:branched-chain amino acid transport system permease protein